MKNKIFSILGIVTVLVTLFSLFGFAAPVSAGTQSWTSIAAPAVSRYVVFVGPMAQAKDGVLYTSVGIAGDSTAANNGVWLYKSTDGGRTWKKTTQPGQRPGLGLQSNITVSTGNSAVYTDIQCPGPDGTMVYATDGFDIFKSVDGGTTWIPLTNLFEKLDDESVGSEEPVGFIVSISTGFIGGSVSPSAYTFAATTTFGGSVLGSYNNEGGSNNNGGVYVLQESVFLNPWADTEVTEDRPAPWVGVDALKVMTMPDFATTQGVMAVISDRAHSRTLVTTKYGAGQWNTTANDVILRWNAGGHPPTSNVSSMLLGASIYMPSDFSSNPASANMVVFVGINAADTQQSDVSLCQFGPAAATPFTPTNAYDLNIDGDNGTSVSGMSGVGPAATASIMVSGYDVDDVVVPNVWVTRNGGVSWTTTDDNINAKRPTGGASEPDPALTSGWGGLYPVALSSCVVMSDFATSGKALVGTHGTDCGLSYSQDWGLTWNTIAFISTRIVATDDLSLATDATMYMSTDFLGAGVTAQPGQSFTASATTTTTPAVLGNADSVRLLCTAADGDDVITGRLTLLAGTQPTITVTDNGGATPGDNFFWIDATHAIITLDGTADTADIAATSNGTMFSIAVDTAEILPPLDTDNDGAWTLTVLNDQAPHNTGAFQALIGGPSFDASTHYYTYSVSLPDAAGWVITPASTTYNVGGFDLVVNSGSVTVSGAASGNGTFTSGTNTITVGSGNTSATGSVATVQANANSNVTVQNPTGAPPVLSPSFSYPHTYILAGPVTGMAAPELYSEWRYSGGFWERINSWSLYGYVWDSPPSYGLLPDFDFIQTLPDQSALFTVDENQNQLYRSLNKGQTWLLWGQPFPNTILSWLVVSPTTVAIGSFSGIIYTTINGTIWNTRQAFSSPSTVIVTDIRAAANGDWLAAGIDSAGDICAAKSTNAGVGWTSTDLGATARFPNSTKAFIGAAADYATSGVVDVTGNGTGTPGEGIYWGKITSPATTFYRADSDTDDWYLGNGASGLITSPGGPGFAAEGTGMAYALANPTNSLFHGGSNYGLERIKGRVDITATAAGEFIPGPNAVNPGPGTAVHGLWVAANAVGGVALFTVTDAGVVWTYTDTLNVATSGVKATAVTATSCTNSCPTGTAGGMISWNAVTNANLYFVIIDTAQWTNFYDANDWAEENPGLATVTTGLSVTWTGEPNTTYYVSVWALRTQTPLFVEATSFENFEGTVISTFGSGTSFTTPLPSPTNLSPDTTTFNVPVKPTFSWTAVPGATGYQLQISATPDFASPIFDSGTTALTSTSYVYTGTALANSTGYYWRVRALGTNNSDWVTAVFSTAAVTTPPVTVSQLPQPTIIVTNPPAVTVTVAAPVPAPILTVTQPTFTIAQPEVTTPGYIWIIVGVGALLTLMVIILIIRTRRVV